jgi:hypothetical protein
VGTGGGSGNLAADESDAFDLLTNLQFAFSGAARVTRGRWSFSLDSYFARLGSEVQFTLTDGTVVDGELRAFLGRVMLGYTFARPRVTWPGGRRGWVDLEAILGTRVYHTALEVDGGLLGVVRIRRDSTWADPLVGLAAHAYVSPRVRVHLLADVGGAGVGSELSWSAKAEVEWFFARRWSLRAGYVVVGLERRVGGGDGRFVLDLLLRGPQASVVLHL